jgi:hypothetical protein
MTLHPFHQTSIYETNTRLFCREWNLKIGKDLAHAYLSLPEVQSSEYIWAMGIWQSSLASIEICKSHQGLIHEFKNCLNDFSINDIIGSPYSIFDYSPNTKICESWNDLKIFREELNSAGKKLILDFVPNHLSVDSHWISKRPLAFLDQSSKFNATNLDQNHFIHSSGRILTYGRDPYFDGWTDTVQYDFSHPDSIELAIEFLLKIAEYSDGVRCDMAMLPLSEIFEKTHGIKGLPYWETIIPKIEKIHPDFLWIAEVYWGLEYSLQTKGFHLTYDKSLYDRFQEEIPEKTLGHLRADISFQNKSLRFLENHDEKRAFDNFGGDSIVYWSVLNFLNGGILIHEGQSKGYSKKIPVQIGRYPEEETNPEILSFYLRSFDILKKRVNLEFSNPEFFLYERSPSEIFIKILFNSKQWEILIWNPQNFIVSGRIKINSTLPENMRLSENCLFRDIIQDNYYSHDTKDILEQGLYFKLNPNQSHWMVLHNI